MSTANFLTASSQGRADLPHHPDYDIIGSEYKYCMKTVHDVQQLLKSYGVFVYVGNRLADLEMMKMEIKDLYMANLIDQGKLKECLAILHSEILNEQHK